VHLQDINSSVPKRHEGHGHYTVYNINFSLKFFSNSVKYVDNFYSEDGDNTLLRIICNRAQD
jgi:hypothetical protein